MQINIENAKAACPVCSLRCQERQGRGCGGKGRGGAGARGRQLLYTTHNMWKPIQKKLELLVTSVHCNAKRGRGGGVGAREGVGRGQEADSCMHDCVLLVYLCCCSTGCSQLVAVYNSAACYTLSSNAPLLTELQIVAEHHHDHDNCPVLCCAKLCSVVLAIKHETPLLQRYMLHDCAS